MDSHPSDVFPNSPLAGLFDGLPLGVYVLRLEGPHAGSLRIVFANRATETLLGVDRALTVGGLLADVFPNSAAHATEYHRVVVDQETRHLGIVSYGDDRVEENRFAVSAYPIGPDLVAVVFDNLSAESERRTELAAIVETAEDAILSKSLDGTIMTWNASAERLYGYTAAEAIGQPAAMLLPPDRPDEVADVLDRLRAGEHQAQYETTRLRRDGTPVEVSLTVSPIKDAQGNVVGAATIARGIGEQKEADARMRELVAIVAASEDAIIHRSPDGLVRSWNAGAERLFGYTAEEMIGGSADVLVPPNADGHVRRLRESLNRGERQPAFETRMRRKDGTEVYVSVASSPITDDAGAVIGVAGVIRDVTAQHRLEEQLRQAQKLEAIGSLAGGVAHDFNNALTVIRNAGALLLDELDDERLRERVLQIDRAADHAATLTQQLLAFGRQQVLLPEPTDLNACVEATLELIDRLIGSDIRVERRLSPALPAILIDRGQLQQVIVNLSVNARDAMGSGGTLTVGTSTAALDERYATENPGVTPGRYVLLEFTDTGTGMDAETLDRLFEPFFTTKEAGTGLGLATVFGIVKQSGGHIAAYSEPGIGTTMKVYLPPTDGAVAAPVAAPAAIETLEGHETILLVEDAEMLRPVVTEMLESYGYTVLAAADGVEALALAAEHAGPIDLLLTDVVMPRMNGRELAERVRLAHPETKILFTSGYPADTMIRRGIAEGAVAFIQKPYLAEELLTKLRATLAAAG